mmetsp:Transcript_17421/g.45504  ORF Transcript_17421/g.45504 Transcript_17421/m.45504 type:complete len:545 (+) Transcript_17421:104-1738(+)
MLAVLGEDGSVSGPVVLSLFLGLVAYRLFARAGPSDRPGDVDGGGDSRGAIAFANRRWWLFGEGAAAGPPVDGSDIMASGSLSPAVYVTEAHRRGMQWFESALSAEEAKNYVEASKGYQNAVMCFQKGMASGAAIAGNEQYKNEQDLVDKMQSMLPALSERKAEIEKKLPSEKPGKPAKKGGVSLIPKRFWNMKGAESAIQRPPRNQSDGPDSPAAAGAGAAAEEPPRSRSGGKGPGGKQELTADEKALGSIDKKIYDQIMEEIVESGAKVTWDQIIGLDKAKKALHETVILPQLRPDLFTGLRAPARGLLLFGPPGNGKTMLAKALAHETSCKFFNVSASTLVAKYLGESEKLVRALFTIARVGAPSIIFIDECDSILTKRGENEHEASRRLKTELLVQFDGVQKTNTQARLLVMGATNLPWEIDEAALRRFTKRIYIRMPTAPERGALLQILLKKAKDSLSRSDIDYICKKTSMFSNSDLTALATDAAMGPIRELGGGIANVKESQIRPINRNDFIRAIANIRPSTSYENLQQFEQWAADYP